MHTSLTVGDEVSSMTCRFPILHGLPCGAIRRAAGKENTHGIFQRCVVFSLAVIPGLPGGSPHMEDRLIRSQHSEAQRV